MKKILQRLSAEQRSILEDVENFAVHAHADTNHFYDDYLPYRFHLELVVKAACDNAHLLSDGELFLALCCAWLHDTIEDCRVSYNTIASLFGTRIADVVFALTNEKGKTRKERANDKYYLGISQDKIAVFVKLCDRIANVEYSRLKGSSMFKKYGTENSTFIEGIFAQGDHGFDTMRLNIHKMLNN